MNRNTTSALVLALATTVGSAHASDITIDPVVFHGTRSRSEVTAELAQFRASRVNPWSISYNQIAATHSTRTRAEVRRDYIASRDTVAAEDGEDSGAFYLARRPLDSSGTMAAHDPVKYVR